MSQILSELDCLIGKDLKIVDGPKTHVGRISRFEIVARIFLKISLSDMVIKEGSQTSISTQNSTYAINLERVNWKRNAEQKIIGFDYEHQTCEFLSPIGMKI